MVPTPKSNRNTRVTFYDTNYDNFQIELYSEIRREAFGEDIGQNSWMTTSEQDMFLWLANCYGRADFTGNRAAQVNWPSPSECIRWQ